MVSPAVRFFLYKKNLPHHDSKSNITQRIWGSWERERWKGEKRDINERELRRKGPGRQRKMEARKKRIGSRRERHKR